MQVGVSGPIEKCHLPQTPRKLRTSLGVIYAALGCFSYIRGMIPRKIKEALAVGREGGLCMVFAA